MTRDLWADDHIFGERFERWLLTGTILDRNGWDDPAKDGYPVRGRSPCAMVACPYRAAGEHRYCDVCRAIWPDLKEEA